MPAAVGALVDLRSRSGVQRCAEPGRGDHAAPDEDGQHRVVLVRHRGRSAPGPLAELADLRSRADEDVVGDQATGIVDADERVGEPGDRRPIDVPGRSRLQTEECGERGRGIVELCQWPGQGPGGATELERQCVGGAEQVLGRVEDGMQPGRSDRAEGGRYGRLGQRAPAPHRVAVCGRECAHGRNGPSEVGGDGPGRVPARQDQGRIEDVLRRQATMQSGRLILITGVLEEAPQFCDERDDRVARKFRTAVDDIDQRGRIGDQALDPGVPPRAEPRTLHGDHRVDERCVAHRRPGPRRTWLEEGHRRCPG